MPSSSVMAARAAEFERQRGIKKATGKVDAIYEGREPQYDDFLQALRDRYSDTLGEEKRGLDRQTTFDIARRGVTKGSSDLDARRRNQRAFIQSLIGAENRAQSSVGRLRSTDEASRRGLLNLIYGGMDATTAAQRAGRTMQADLQSSMSDIGANTIGSSISSGLDIYNYGQQRQDYRRGQDSARRELYAG